MKLSFKLAALLLAIHGAAFAAVPAYKVTDTIAIGGAAKWDYMYVDSAAHRLYVAHATQTEVIDTQSNRVIGNIPHTMGVHGIAIASDLGIGFTSDGKADSVTVFDLNTLQPRSTIKVGSSPDSIVYSPADNKLVVFNGHSSNVSIIDAKTLAVIATLAVGGKPEFSVLGADHTVYFNIEDTAELGTINLQTNKLSHRQSLKPCEAPTGLAIDDKQNLFSVCANRVMVVSDGKGKILSTPGIGSGPDGVAWMDGYAFSANGADANISVVGNVDGQFKSVATIPTTYGARTIAADPSTHRLYLPTADFEPPQGTEKRQGRPDTFRIIVVQQQ